MLVRKWHGANQRPAFLPLRKALGSAVTVCYNGEACVLLPGWQKHEDSMAMSALIQILAKRVRISAASSSLPWLERLSARP